MYICRLTNWASPINWANPTNWVNPTNWAKFRDDFHKLGQSNKCRQMFSWVTRCCILIADQQTVIYHWTNRALSLFISILIQNKQNSCRSKVWYCWVFYHCTVGIHPKCLTVLRISTHIFIALVVCWNDIRPSDVKIDGIVDVTQIKMASRERKVMSS